MAFGDLDRVPKDWSEVCEALFELKRRAGRLLFLEDTAGFEMSVAYVPNFGFYVSTLSAASRERVASDRALTSDRVRVVIADEQNVPRSILLGDEAAVIVVRDFFNMGNRSAAVDWIDPFDVIN